MLYLIVNAPIPFLRIGVPDSSRVGFFGIAGVPTVVDNAIQTFQHYGAIPPGSDARAAVRFSRAMAQNVARRPFTDQLARYFLDCHELICQEVAAIPPSLREAYEGYGRRPSSAGIALYFDRLAGILEAEFKGRRP